MPNIIRTDTGRFPIYLANKAEQKAFKRLYERECSNPNNPDIRQFGYRRFRKEIMYDTMNGCYMIKLQGIYIGIESDGYTHT